MDPSVQMASDVSMSSEDACKMVSDISTSPEEDCGVGFDAEAQEESSSSYKSSCTTKPSVVVRMETTLYTRKLATVDTPALLMVSGGSDSTALAYLAFELHVKGLLGLLGILHVNHQLRGEDADADARFVEALAELLDIPLFMCEIDVAAEVKRTGDNVEAVARRERYLAANEALRSLCQLAAAPIADGRILTAHTSNDRVESFYMRSIVGTGPGGFRSMRYMNGPVVRPLMDVSREDLRAYLQERERAGQPVACDEEGNLWREDATNAHTDHFRAFVRHEIVPRAKERNGQLLDVLCRSMNLIADEDDFMDDLARETTDRCVKWQERDQPTAGCMLVPELGIEPLVVRRRVIMQVLKSMLGLEARIDTAAVEAVLAAYDDGDAISQVSAPRSGYVTNIQGNLAVSSNKRGVRIEPMAAFRARRKHQ